MADELLRSDRGVKINLKTSIRYNGREYSSLEELPEPVRAIYEKLTSSGNASDTSTASEGGVVVKKTFVFNGKKFASPDEIPEADRKIYNDLIQLVRAKGCASRGGEIDDKSSDMRLQPMSSTTSTSVADTGWLTPSQKKLVAVVAGLILIAALVIALRSLS